MTKNDVKRLEKLLENVELLEYKGRVSKVIGLTIESEGPEVSIGELCELNGKHGQESIQAEVVGFRDNKVLLMPLGEMGGIGPGSRITATGGVLEVAVGSDLVGRVLDGTGSPIDGRGLYGCSEYRPVNGRPPHPLQRNRISQPLTLGIKAIDGLLTVGKGQRIGIFSGSGVGKSTLLGMIARNTRADVNVIALIGERGREVREFIERDLTDEGLKRSVLVVATSDQPALVRLKGAMAATAIAEYFRDQGKDVLFLMDSLTRFAMAQREVGLAVGEPPVSRGYTPSVFSVMPRLLERAGNSKSGSITGLYTVLVDGDDMTEPVTDTARGILDGHIVLSRSLANRNHYPAVDILQSVSRVMNDIIDEGHSKTAVDIKRVLAVYREAEDLINVGAYSRGSSKDIDYSIDNIERINAFLVQGIREKYEFEQITGMMGKVLKTDGDVPVQDAVSAQPEGAA